MITPVQMAPVPTRPRLSPTASAHLDMARGLAALAVLFQHMRSVLLLDWEKTTAHSLLAAAVYLLAKFGHAAVMVFFVLSGFLVGSSGLRAVENRTWSFRRYLLHRLLRLEIVLIPALFIGLLWDELGVHALHASALYNGGWHLLVRWGPIDLSWRTLLGNAAFVQGILVPALGTNTPLWSLAYEFWYYMLYGLLVTALLTSRRVWLRVVLGALALAVMWFTGSAIMFLAPLWFLGLGVYLLPQLRLAPLWRRAFLVVSGLLFLSALGGGVLAYHGIYTQNPWFDIATGVLFSIALYAMLHANPVRPGYQQTAHRLAAPSYTLYANHMPALFVLLALLGVRQTPTPLRCLELAGWFLVYWVYAYGIYLLFESRTQSIRRWIEPRIFPAD